jgi:hypothetical protein
MKDTFKEMEEIIITGFWEINNAFATGVERETSTSTADINLEKKKAGRYGSPNFEGRE